MQTRCILFDVDGLMVDSEKLSFTIIKEILQEHGYEMSLDFYIKLIGISQQTGAQLISETFPGVNGMTDVFSVFEERYKEAVKKGCLKLKPGLCELLDELDQRNIPRAVASSNVEEVVKTNLESANVLHRIDAVVYDGMVKHVKPYPDLFLKAAELLGAKPGECLVLEDSTAGIQAAYSAGIPAIVIPDLIQPTEETLKMCIGRMESLFDVIKYIIQNDIHANRA